MEFEQDSRSPVGCSALASRAWNRERVMRGCLAALHDWLG